MDASESCPSFSKAIPRAQGSLPPHPSTIASPGPADSWCRSPEQMQTQAEIVLTAADGGEGRAGDLQDFPILKVDYHKH